MSVAQATEFINVCQADQELAKSVEDAPNREARAALAASKGYSFTFDEMAQAVSEYSPAQSATGELSDEALAGIAGGGYGTAGGPGGFSMPTGWWTDPGFA
jgi:predicted ribosomally synthesized peptide with nif11-like leader